MYPSDHATSHWKEIQRAHDLLVPIITGELPIEVKAQMKLTPEMRDRLMISCDALCWVLKHDHNPTFEEYIYKLEAQLKEIGLNLTDHGN